MYRIESPAVTIVLVSLFAIASSSRAQDGPTTNIAAVKTIQGDSPAILKSEFIFETAPFPSCHASTIAQTKDGLVAAWFGGTRERNPDVGIWVSRNDGKSWSKPVEVANGIQPTGPRLPTWNPVLYQSPNGPLVLFYKVGPSPSTWWGMRMTSDDGGQSWTKPAKLPDGFLGPIKDKPILLSDGRLLCPSSIEGSATSIHMEFTTDLVLTFTKTEPLSDPKVAKLIQPTVLDHGNGVLQYLCRNKPNMYEGWSQDNGKTWSAPAVTKLPCPGSGLDAVQLKDGRSLLAYDDSPDARHPLVIALSPDGKSWGKPIMIEDTDGPQLSYPAVIQTDDGLVHITYTWLRKRIRHTVVDPAKIQ
jgi:predicted neuraminidase